MPAIAVDIALLPPQEIMDQAIAVNKTLLRTNKEIIVLDKSQCLPHVSLAMGFIEDKNIPAIRQIMKEVAQEFSTLDLEIVRTSTTPTPEGDPVSQFDIENNKELQKLHKTIMLKVIPFFEKKGEIGSFLSPPPVAETTMYWVKGYRDHSSFEDYKPHITLGFGKAGKLKEPVSFTATTLALCHLGTYCTCRKVLGEAVLKEN